MRASASPLCGSQGYASPRDRYSRYIHIYVCIDLFEEFIIIVLYIFIRLLIPSQSESTLKLPLWISCGESLGRVTPAAIVIVIAITATGLKVPVLIFFEENDSNSTTFWRVPEPQIDWAIT
jgi:hypothetical protein